MKLFGTYREIYKNNKTTPEEVIIDKKIFKTFEEATRYALHEQDANTLRYGYRYITHFISMQEQHNSKTGKTTTYRHEWNVKEYEIEA